MKTSEIVNFLEGNLSKIHYTSVGLSNGSFKVTSLEKAFNAINEVAKIGVLDPDIKRLKSLENIYASRSLNDEIIVSRDNMEKIAHHINIVREKIEAYIGLIKVTLPPLTNETINIKLPQYKDLEDVKDFFSDLDKALRLGLMNPEIQGSYQLNHFENGSLWIGINISENVQLLFGKIVKFASKYKNESSEILNAQVQIEKIGLDADAYADLNRRFEIQLAEIATKYVEELTEDYNAIEDIKFSSESQNNLQYSIRKVSGLIQEGTEFYPSLAVSEEVRREFPQPKKSLPSPMLQISEKSTEIQ